MMIELEGGENHSLYAIHDNKLYELLYGEEGLLDPIDGKQNLSS